MARPDIDVHIAANSKAFHDAMAKMRRDARATGSQGVSSFGEMAKTLRGLGPAIAGAGVVVAVKAVVDKVGEAVNAVRELDAQARTAGVGFEEFQELSYAAKQNKVSVDALTDGLKEMQLRIDEVVKTGKGSAAESLGRLGYTAKELAVALKEPDKLFEDIIERMKTLDKAAQIRVADEIFGGTAGEQFVRMLDDAHGAINLNRQAARELGIVISDDVRQRVIELQGAWDDIYSNLKTRVMVVVLEIATAIGMALDRFNELENRTSATLKEDAKNLKEYRQVLSSELQQARAELAEAEQNGFGGGLTDYMRANVQRLEAEMASLEDTATRVDAIIKDRPADTDNKPFLDPIKPSSLGASKTRDKAAAEAERERKAVLDLIAALEHEARTTGLSQQDKRIANELRKAGAAATEEQRDRIRDLVVQIDAEKEAIERTREATEKAKEVNDFFAESSAAAFRDLVPDINTGNAALDRFLNTLIDVTMQALLLGQGPLAGLFGGIGGGGGLIGSLFGGLGSASFVPNTTFSAFLGLAGGTDYAKGGLTVVGEKGPELLQLPAGAGVSSNFETSRMLAGLGGGGDTINAPVSIAIDATGADAAGLDRVAREVAKLKAELPSRIVETVTDARKRRIIA